MLLLHNTIFLTILLTFHPQHNHNNHNNHNNTNKKNKQPTNRRTFLTTATTASSLVVTVVGAAEGVAAVAKESVSYFNVIEQSSSSISSSSQSIQVEYDALSSEYCLLKLLPVKDEVFRTLQGKIEVLSLLLRQKQSLDEGTYYYSYEQQQQQKQVDVNAWKNAKQCTLEAFNYLESNRGKLERVFNEQDSAMMQILKGEKFETLVDNLRNCTLDMVESTSAELLDESLNAQRRALIALSEVGELLVSEFPYEVPEDGKYANLPRLLGRCKVTFTF